MKLDKFDLKIILQLLENSRRPLSEIARNIGRSRQFVNYRIKRLEKFGVIRRYVVALRVKKLGYLSYRILARGRKIRKIPKVFGIRYIGISKDGLDISIISRDGLNLQYLINYLRDLGFETELMLKGKTIIPFNFSRVSMENFIKKGETAIVDEKFFRIIDALERSRNILEAAKRLRVSADFLKEFLRENTGKTIRGFSILFDEKFFGYKRVSIFVISKKPKEFPRNLRVNLLEKLCGRYDFRIEYIYKKEKELNELLDRIDPYIRKLEILDIDSIF